MHQPRLSRSLIVLAPLLILSACGADKPAAAARVAETAPNVAQAASAAAASAAAAPFDINSLPSRDIGAFPFFTLPDGFKALDDVTRSFEQKYVFPGGVTRLVEGKYHHADVMVADGGEWNETLLLRSFDAKIRELGGVQVFDGGIPDDARDQIKQTNPKSIADLYDPGPYRFRQYAIRTPQGPVWIELGYGYNTQMVDLSVLQEAGLQQTIRSITADEVEREIQATGKAVLHINFDTDRASLKPDGLAAVDEIAAVLQRTPALRLSIEGHTDDTGSAEHNRTLSLDRAKAVQTALTGKAIAPDRLKVAGFGSDKPLGTGTAEADRASNRRVELVRF